MFKKILVANRGEIAIRAMRAAYELGAKTVAVYPYEDRTSLHRQKADEAYQIGEPGHPVRAYLDVSEIIRVAKESGCDAIYPGYGFLSENPDLAQAAAEAGITFIGPTSSVLEMAGNKVTAKEHAVAAGVPVLKSTPASNDLDELIAGAADIGFPIFAKAVAGGGGRGMRRVDTPDELRPALEEAMREADSAFGDPTMFLEQAVVRPRHIEVQILADATGDTIHLFERDCSVQRRHQKVIEIAPAPNLDEETRQALYRDAIAFAKSIGYVNAGTVEFLLDTAGERKGQHVFIEMNPRIQVEHTVTEEVTDVDLVQSQMRIAAGETLEQLGLRQDELTLRGAALQCRITTEDPAAGFRPDTGKITTYRSPGGAGIRLDGGTINAGAQVSPHFDSMLVKMTTRGRDFASAVRRARRGLAEFRLRGVATNIPFLQAVLDDPDFIAGDLSTSFIDERPQLLTANKSQDRGTRLLTWLAETTVNHPNGEGLGVVNPESKLPELDLLQPAPPGSRQRLLELGPAGFAKALREQTPLAVTETTFRDAHQSLLATRVRTRDLVAVLPYVARLTPGLLSVEAWGGATYDVALRFLAEDPWERLDAIREALPNIAIQMLLRGRNTVGYTPYPTEVTDAFVREAAAGGRRHLPDLRRAQRRVPDASRDRRGARAGHARSPRSRSATPATCSIPPKTSTRSTTTCASPSRSSTPARTSSPSRTWPGSCAPGPRRPWSPRCASGSSCRCTCTPTTRRGASWRRCWPPAVPAPMRWMWRAHRWRARPASRRCPRWWRRSPTPSATPVSRCRR